MKNKFDELTKGLAQSVTRRAALKKFSLGLAGMALACFGLSTKAAAVKPSAGGKSRPPNWCDRSTNFCCCRNCHTHLPPDDTNWWNCESACALGCGGF